MATHAIIETDAVTPLVRVAPAAAPWEPSIEFDASRHWARRIVLFLVIAGIGGVVAWFVKNKLDSDADAERKEYAEDIGHFAGPQPDPDVVDEADEAEAEDPIDDEGRIKA